MARPDRAETRMLYGRRRVPRSHRRIMIALLATDGITAWNLMQLAQAGVSTTTVLLVKLQTLGWAEMDRTPLGDDKRIRYRLTPAGEIYVRRLLGLAPAPWGGMTGRAND